MHDNVGRLQRFGSSKLISALDGPSVRYQNLDVLPVDVLLAGKVETLRC